MSKNWLFLKVLIFSFLSFTNLCFSQVMDVKTVNYIFNVKNFGAMGDGISDDTQAIQHAIDSAATVKASVFFPDGTYLCSTLHTHDYVGLIGNPLWAYYTKDTGGAILKLNDPSASCLLNLEYCRGVRISGLSLMGNQLGDSIHGIWVAKKEKRNREDFPAIERTMITGFTGDGIKMDNIWCFSIRGCAIGLNGGDGLKMSGADGYIIDTWISGNNGAGIRAQEGTGSTTITANRIEWNRGGGLLISAAWNYNITGNCIDRAWGPAIKLCPDPKRRLSCYNFTITGNTILRSGNVHAKDTLAEYDHANVWFEECGGLVFTGNSLSAGGDDGGTGIVTPTYGMVLRGLIDSVVRNNVMFRGAEKQLIVDLGGHQNSLILDNVGSLVTSKK